MYCVSLLNTSITPSFICLQIITGFQLFLRPVTIIQYIQQISDHISTGCLNQFHSFFGVASFEIIKLSHFPQVFIFYFFQFSFQFFQVLILLPPVHSDGWSRLGSHQY